MSSPVSKIEGRLALVTGAGSGIGRAVAIALADAGARVVVVDVDDDRVRDIAARLGGRCALARRVDVSNRDEMRTLARDVHATFGALGVLVNNAGVGHAGGILDTSLEDWDFTFSVNWWGVVHGCHFFVPEMVRAGSPGQVVNVASAFGLFAAPGVAPYCATKFAVVGFSESLRGELAPHGVGVSVVCPGIIATDVIRRARFADESMRPAVAERFARQGHPPEAVARAVVRAIRRDLAVVPVGHEAWIAYFGKRAAPGITAGIARRTNARMRTGR
jgi:NAD(P)-dependent dehydrogenase (short-subunit alcohol dehydrogenase family)